MALFSISQFFFFQAEDGIRDYKVTGVQTCALPIYGSEIGLAQGHFGNGLEGELEPRRIARGAQGTGRIVLEGALVEDRSEERRVGKEGSCRGGGYAGRRKRAKKRSGSRSNEEYSEE